ncbi:hypothetical protein RW26_20535 [Aeromonas sp. L_1B5_3]|nr:hypothetical protein RW26_20535 [Aeromonas sp. L_1B5_3]
MGKYKPYPEYKDSGVEWLGDMPSHWLTSKLRYMFTFGKGLTITKENLRDEGIPCVNYGEVHSKYGFEVDPTKHPLRCVEEDYLKTSSSSVLNIGDFVFADTSEDIDGSGNFTQLTSDVVTFAGYHTIIVRPIDKSSHRFFAYLFDSKEFRTAIRHAVKGVKVFSITQAILRGADIWLPSQDERQRIAAFLDYETARIDRLIAQQQRLIELLKEKRQAVISHAVTKGLNPDAPMKDSGVEWLGQVPKHWIVAGFKKYIEPIVDYRGKTPTKTESGVFLVTARNIKNGSIDYHLSEEFISEDDYEEVMRRGKPKLGDVLFTTEAPLGEVAQVDNESIALAQRIIKFRGLRDILDCSYLKLFIQSTEFQHGLMTFATGSTALGIKSDRLGYLKQLVPPISEQTQIVEVVAKHAMQFGKLIDIANKAIQLMQERRTALISAAVTGKIDLRGWTQPAEEVAA